ncbi:MAG: hypothetical protein H0W88_06045 [Parachlamydiaceae bacterium]|nr:hypothetical protein [Parachlamydiaceae bacterium]
MLLNLGIAHCLTMKFEIYEILRKNQIEKWASAISVYCYFDNDEKGFAIHHAKILQHLLL